MWITDATDSMSGAVSFLAQHLNLNWKVNEKNIPEICHSEVIYVSLLGMGPHDKISLKICLCCIKRFFTVK